MGRFRDRDFLQTREGFFFCTVGPHHPQDRVISYLKYIPSKSGVWGKAEKRFGRVMSAYTIPDLLETFSFLEKNHPHYLFYSPVYNTTLSGVPRRYISKHYKPELKLTRLLRAPHLDPLQRKLTRFAEFLAEASKVPIEFLGVTGSLLLDIHQPTFSDMDMTVYGLRNSSALRNALTEEYASSNSLIKRLEKKAAKAWCARKARRYPLTLDEAFQIYKRKWNQGVFENTSFSVHPVKSKQGATEEYGAKIYYPEGHATLRAVVDDNTEYLFLPAVYRIKDVQIVEGPEVADIVEVVSYESLYDSMAEVEEQILVEGKLERVIDNKTSQNYHRVLVGSTEGRGREYIKLAVD